MRSKKMPNKIKSKKQFRFLQAATNSGLSDKSAGPSPEVAKRMLSHESGSKKKKLAKR